MACLSLIVMRFALLCRMASSRPNSCVTGDDCLERPGQLRRNMGRLGQTLDNAGHLLAFASGQQGVASNSLSKSPNSFNSYIRVI
jgi:hypothetical protein